MENVYNFILQCIENNYNYFEIDDGFKCVQQTACEILVSENKEKKSNQIKCMLCLFDMKKFDFITFKINIKTSLQVFFVCCCCLFHHMII